LPDAREPLQDSLREEERVAAWVYTNIEKVTQQYREHEERQAAS
jgi:hypothetical protein